MELKDNMDRVIPRNIIRKRKIKAGLIIVGIALAIGLSYSYGMHWIKPSLKKGQFKTAVISRQQVYESIMATGTVKTEAEVLILSPVTGRLKQIVRGPGSRVEKNDTILYVDKRSLQKEIINLRDQLSSKENSIYKSQLDAKDFGMDFEYNSQEKQLKIEALKSQIKEEKQLLDVGGISEENVKKTKQGLELKKKGFILYQKQNAIRLEKLKLTQRTLELDLRMKRRELETKIGKLNATTVCASGNGVIISINGKEGEIIREDQELVRVSNLNSFKILGKISDSQVDKINSGGRVIAINNGVKLEGVIGNIRPEVSNREVKFDVFLKNSSHSSLRPNQQLELQLVISEKNNVLSLPDGPFFDGSKQLEAYKINGNTAIKVPVSIGLNNFELIEITKGLEEGDEVIISDVSKYLHLDEIELKQ